MAGLSPVDSAVATVRDRDRGQLLLVGAFGLAVLLLVFAGVMNTVTHTESLATRDSTAQDGRDVATFQEDARRAVHGIGVHINRENASSGTKQLRLERNVSAWSETAGRYQAMEVTGVDVVVTDSTGGAFINQTTERNFTNAHAESDWTLATGVSNTRGFEMRVHRSSLPSNSCENVSCYEVVVDDGSATWNVTMNESFVFVDGPGTNDGTCPIDDSTVDVNLTAGTVDGTDCAPLSFAEGLTDPYDVRYRNSTNVEGTYRLTVFGGSVDRRDYAADGEPSVHEFVSDAAGRVTYRTPRLHYETDIQVVWGGPDG